jgi:hypothetical protein
MSGTKNVDGIELFEDAWSRFERARDVVLKGPPQHRAVKKAKGAKKLTSHAKAKRASRASRSGHR